MQGYALIYGVRKDLCIVFQIIEGYGQTESHALSNVQLIGDFSAGNIYDLLTIT